MNRYDFEGRVALVTGAGSGIGEACATTFARGGARVVVSDIDAGGGTRVVEAIEKSGGEARFVRTDVADPEKTPIKRCKAWADSDKAAFKKYVTYYCEESGLREAFRAAFVAKINKIKQQHGLPTIA